MKYTSADLLDIYGVLDNPRGTACTVQINVIENNQSRTFSVFRWKSQLMIDQMSVQFLRAKCERSQHMGWSVSIHSFIVYNTL